MGFEKTMINKVEKIKITNFTHPFAAAFEKCNFKDRNYLEEEFFISGTSNVYEWKNNCKSVKYQDCPYVNRLIVRKPAEKEIFSGNVIVEILNSTSFIDFDRCWVLTHKYMMRNGDIYIGITSKPNVIPAMLKVDYKRYCDLKWSNPNRAIDSTIDQNELGNMEGASSPETEDGLFWDMLIDLAMLLRDSNNSMIGEYGSYYQYLAGWSQSGAYMIRFVNDFAYDNKERSRPYFDGYYSAGSASSCMPDLNQSYGRTAMKSVRKLKRMEQPFIEIHTESENALWGNMESRGENSFDDNAMKYCIYDIPGATHDAKSTMIDYYFGDTDVFLAGIIPSYSGKEIVPNDFPYEVAFQAALSVLYKWVRKNEKPVKADQIKVDENLCNIVDETGNAIGGYRLPFIEAPLCIYHPMSTPMKPDYAVACTLFGYVENYTREKAVALYGSREGYLNKIARILKDDIRCGMILKDDETACMEYAIQKAKEVFG